MSYHAITLDEQITEVKAELAFRTNVYRKQVVLGKMRQETADRKYALMRGVLHTLMEVQIDAAHNLWDHKSTEAPARDRTEEGIPQR